MKTKEKSKKVEGVVRSDGWFYSAEGMKKLVDGGHKGHDLYEKSIESKMGTRHKVLRSLDRDAVDVLKQIKDFVQRAMFLSTAIVKEAQRRAKKGAK